jgi:tartrate-resistant acid phosphatase type 5
MGSLGDRCYKPSFVVSTGDNFYSHGLKGPHDPYFKQTFSDMYSAPSLQVPWYAVLGNHDYGEANSALLWACASPSFDTCPKDCCLSAAWQVSPACHLSCKRKHRRVPGSLPRPQVQPIA